MQKALILPRPAGRCGSPERFDLPGASESPGHQGFAGGKTLGEDKINAGLLISSVVEFAPQLLGLLHAKSIDFVLVNAHELPDPYRAPCR